MNLIVRSPVWDDLRQIGLRIADDNPETAEKFFIAAKETFELLRQYPGLGRLRSFSIPGIRSWAVKDFHNYIIFYLPTETEVQILAVLHGARDLSSAMAQRWE
jgi:toxin ParE1/3/4